MILARKRFIRRRYSEKDDPNLWDNNSYSSWSCCMWTNETRIIKNHESKEEKKTGQKEMKMNQEVTAPKEMNQGASNDLLTTSLKM